MLFLDAGDGRCQASGQAPESVQGIADKSRTVLLDIANDCLNVIEHVQ